MAVAVLLNLLACNFSLLGCAILTVGVPALCTYALSDGEFCTYGAAGRRFLQACTLVFQFHDFEQ
jgi:hypothetical protein